MFQKLLQVWAGCLILLLCGCASRPQNLIVGTWEADAAVKLVAEFRPDGTARLTMFGQTLEGTYELNGDELVWRLNGRTTKAKVNVTATELELTDEANRTIKYKRK
jgi:hypothetical protein